MTKSIPLTRGKSALVDDEDFEWLNQWKWYCNHGYAVRKSSNLPGKQKMIFMHREILQTPDDMESDHINRDRQDNRRENLRVCTTAENQHNAKIRSDNTSGFKGVSFNRHTEKWEARIGNGNRIYLGLFDSLDDAVHVYNKAARELYGKFVPSF